jgi:orotidine-5'-phosphate decarboxylase
VLLLPGYGAQGAGAADVVPGFLDGRRGALVNSSRGISFAYRDARWKGRGWKDAASAALDAMVQELEQALSARR